LPSRHLNYLRYWVILLFHKLEKLIFGTARALNHSTIWTTVRQGV
jgi:hypothetical protein